MLNIDYRDGRPIYEQVAQGIEQLIMHGVLEADGQLPSVRQLAAELSINPNTVQRAFGELEKRGVIYAVKGKGNFVSPNCSRVKQQHIEQIKREMQHLAQQASNLGVSEQTMAAWVTEREKL